LEKSVSDDYFWNENSLSYQDYVVSALSRWLYAALMRNDKSPEVQKIGLITKNLMASPAIVRFDKNASPRLSDSSGERSAPNKALYTATWRVLPTSLGITSAAQNIDWKNLIDPPPNNIKTEALPHVVSRQIPGLDAMQVVAKGWQALLRYGDTGALINRRGQIPWPAEGEMHFLDTKGNKLGVIHQEFQPFNNIARTLQVKSNDTFIEKTSFTIGQGKRLPVGVTYQTACSVQPGKGLSNADNDKNAISEKGSFSYWEIKNSYMASNQTISLKLKCEKSNYLITVDAANIDKVFIANTPSPRNHEVLTGIYIETKPTSLSNITTTIKLQ